MLKLNLENVFSLYEVNKESGILPSLLKQKSQDFDKYRDLIKSRGQGFIDLPSDKDILKEINDFASSIKGKYDEYVILGIGGSMLGPKCILDTFFPDKTSQSKPKVTCVDNVDPYIIESIKNRLDFSKTLFLVQTKSGGTPETIAQYLYFKEEVENRGLSLKDHFVFVTDPEVGYLRKVADEEDIQTFPIPQNVGGRFSVLTAVGLLISALMNLNITKMLKGAEDVVNAEFFEGKSKQAYNLAICNYALAQKNKTNLVIMPYNSRLATFADWAIQLISESTGKEKNLEGDIVNVGLTPIPSLGATDQHSQLQLFKEGPNDKQIIFIETSDYLAQAPIPSKELVSNPGLSYLKDHTFNDLIQAEMEGTRQSLTESLRPNYTLTISKTDEYNLGALFMFFELHTAFLGEFLNINTFDQPGVERSKVLTKEKLS
jgi:glucose-6-phosphate isomerase